MSVTIWMCEERFSYRFPAHSGLANSKTLVVETERALRAEEARDEHSISGRGGDGLPYLCHHEET